MIGELRGWTSDGKSILGIQSYESDSTDAWATSLATGHSVPLTDHAEYTDPMFMSPNGKWMIAEQVLGSGRMDFISGMEGIPPITGLISTAYVDEMRNNGNRRFFLPWLVDPARQQSEQINAGGDPNWNAAADPVWLANSTAVVWGENLACGANPSPHQCPDSTEPGGRNSRVMMARFPTLRPTPAIPPSPISNTAPAAWAIPYSPGQTVPANTPIPTGTYTIHGNVFGSDSGYHRQQLRNRVSKHPAHLPRLRAVSRPERDQRHRTRSERQHSWKYHLERRPDILGTAGSGIEGHQSRRIHRGPICTVLQQLPSHRHHDHHHQRADLHPTRQRHLTSDHAKASRDSQRVTVNYGIAFLG